MADQVNEADEAYNFAVQRKFQAKVDSRKAGRRERSRNLIGAADRRTLRETGRTEQINFKALPAIKVALDKHVGAGRKSMWLEGVIIAALEAEGYKIDG